MKIALLGYGKMGRAIEALAKKQQISIVATVDIANIHDLNFLSRDNCDVIIEFSGPDSCIKNYYKCFEKDIPVVSGTTGWLSRFDEIKDFVVKNNKSFFYASNFSLGVNLFFEMNRKVAKLMNSFPEFKTSIEETHHVHKLDAPSGTAISVADILVDGLDIYKSWELKASDPDSGVLPVNAKREGEVFGVHKVFYASDFDKICLSHEALSRDGFAAGALMAASFLKGKSGIFSMTDLLSLK